MCCITYIRNTTFFKNNSFLCIEIEQNSIEQYSIDN
jgi:hypothetical protein